MHRSVHTLAFAALLASAPAMAQWSPSASADLGMGYGQMALGQAAMDGARRLSRGSEDAFSRPAKKAWKEPEFSPRFKADPSVSEKVNHRFVTFYAGDDAGGRKVMRQKVESREYHRRFQELMKRYGFEPGLDNLLDVSASRYLALWEVVHGTRVTTQQARAVRDQLRAQFSNDFWMRRMRDAEKQELAETFVLHVGAADIAHEELVRRQDADLLARYRAGIQANLLPDGPRLDQLAITDEGFVRR